MSDEREPRIYVLPTMMTAGNILSGFVAILQIFKGREGAITEHYYWAIIAILAACLFDVLDGRVARLGGQESPFGRELDSIADIVSFGVAPALLVHDIVLKDIETPAGLGWLCVGLLTITARLPSGEFRCTFLSVGHGGCTVLETPDGRTLLYDAGAIAGPEVTRRHIAPFLWSRGIRRLDEVILSHADLDHFNGVPGLLRYFSVAAFMILSSIAIEKLLRSTERIGMRSRTAVSKSMPVNPIAASPQTLTHSRSGCASFAPIASPRPYPSWVVFPQPM